VFLIYNYGMQILANWLLSAIAILVTAYIVRGVRVDSFTTALVVAVVLGIVNAILKPILVLLTLPITILTLGLFMFVINALLILLVTQVVPGFKVDGFWTALIFSLILSLVNWFLFSLVK
jgi:putative membrane protein